jgi:F-type H+-transporting ATPase subunit delta
VRGTETAAARRYARALLDLALRAQAAESLRDELRAAVQLLEREVDLREALAHPALTAEKKRQLVEAVWQGGAGDLLVRLLVLLAARNRVALLPAISAAFGQEWNQHRGVLSAEVASAVALDDLQAKAIQVAVERLAGKPVELSHRVEPGLLGGLRLSLAGRVYDGSVRGRLQSLRQTLLGQVPGR